MATSRSAVQRGLPLLAYLGLAALLVVFIEPLEVVGPEQSLAKSDSWTGVGSTQTIHENEIVFSSTTPAAFASHALKVIPSAEFLRVDLCLSRAMPMLDETATLPARPAAITMLASSRDGALDFDRQFVLWGFFDGKENECDRFLLSRLSGDEEDAVAQLQLGAAGLQAGFSLIDVQAVRHTEAWTLLRRVMLGIGLILVAVYFSRYWVGVKLFSLRGLVSTAGLLGVAGILFGCCVSVGLKAEIYALIRVVTSSSPVAANASPLALEDVLQQPFPTPGFGIFTQMHAVFFCATTLLLGLLSRQAITEMLLLAVTTETLQIFVPGRGPGLSDVLVDASGIVIAAMLLLALWRSQRIRAFLQE